MCKRKNGDLKIKFRIQKQARRREFSCQCLTKCIAKNTVTNRGDGKVSGNFQCHIMEFEINLAGLQPYSFSDTSNPFPTVLIRGFVDVPATAK